MEMAGRRNLALLVAAAVVAASVIVATAVIAASVIVAAAVIAASVIVAAAVVTATCIVVVAASIAGRGFRCGRRARGISIRSISTTTLGISLVDPEDTSTMLLAIESVDRGIRTIRIHFNKTEAPGPARRPIVDKIDLVNLSVFGEKSPHFLFTPTERQITYVYTLHCETSPEENYLHPNIELTSIRCPAKGKFRKPARNLQGDRISSCCTEKYAKKIWLWSLNQNPHRHLYKFHRQ